LLVVFELKLTRQLDLFGGQFVFYLVAVLHPHSQMLLRPECFQDAPVEQVVSKAEIISVCHTLNQLKHVIEVRVLFKLKAANVSHVIVNFYGTIFAKLLESYAGFNF